MAAPLAPAEYRYQLAHMYQSTSTSIIAVNVVLPIIATVFVILRMIAHKRTKAAWQANDFVLIAALLVAYILCIELILCAHFGTGHHLLKLHTNDLTHVLEMQFAIEITWNICTYLVKLSNILLLARIFVGTASSCFRLCLHLVHAFLFLWTTAAFFSVVFRCAPVQSFWDLSVKGSCLHAQAGRIVTVALNSCTDVMLLVLPMWPVWQLHLPVKQKLAVMCLFGVGIFCLAVGAARLEFSVAVLRYRNHDPIYVNAAPLLWASVEPCAGIVCACLPLLRPLFMDLHVGTWGSWFSRSLFNRGSTKEADTWWHPPPEEFEKDNNPFGNVESCGKRADSDRIFLSSDQHKVEANEEVVTVTEVTEGKPSVDIATKAFDRCCNSGTGIGVAV